jgi:ABC-type branched-subunit amino acid transport system ATPase component/branched-subunit amino acid ABC-type transport system permease component
MEKFVSLLIVGLISGGIYALLGSGIALTYQSTGIFNLGYGAIAFVAAYLYFELHSGLQWPIVPAAIVTLLVAGPVLGLALDRLIFRRLTRASEAAKTMATVGVLIALPALAQFIVELAVNVGHASIPTGSQVYSAPGIGPAPPVTWHLGGHVTFDSDQLIVLLVALVSGGALWALLRHTRLGLEMRAVVDRPELAVTRGVSRRRASGAAWMVGTLMAALAGVVGAPIFASLSSSTYLSVMLIAVAGGVLGGFRSVPLAAVGGLLLGALQSLVAGYATFAQNIAGFSDAVPFAALLIGLAVFGRSRTRAAGAAVETSSLTDGDEAAVPSWRRYATPAAWSCIFLLWLLFVADRYWVGLATDGIALGLVFMSFVLVTGTGGVVSMAQASFVTASGLMAGVLIDQYHAPYLVGLLGGVALAVAIGIVVALPALRLGGLALALATLALGFLGDNVLFQWTWLGGPQQQGWTIPRPALGPIHLSSNKTYAILLAVVTAGVAAVIVNLQKSSSGRAMAAIRSAEPAAVTAGISSVRNKLSLFAVSAGIAGLGGVLLVTYDQSATGTTYTTPVGLIWLATVVLWGVRKPTTAIVAGITSSLFTGLLASGFHFSFISWSGTTSPYVPSILFGLGAITMSQNPDGILALNQEQLRALRSRWRGRKKAPAKTAEVDPSLAQPGLPAAGAKVVPLPRAGFPALSVSGINAGYGETQVLFDVSLAAPAGAITALVGANGAGKSTLCAVISGLVAPSSGTVEVDGEDITGMPADKRCSRLMLAPESRGIFPGLSVEDNLSLILRDPGQRETVYQGYPVLRDRRSVPAGHLSGGEQQMLTMAPLMVDPPKVLVIDEPTLGLAPRIAAGIIDMLQELKSQGITVLVVEERAKSVLEIADNVVLLELGRVVWQGRRQNLDQERLTSIYLGQAVIPARDDLSAVDLADAPSTTPTRSGNEMKSS